MYRCSKLKDIKEVVATSTRLLFFLWKTQILHLLKSLRISFPFIGMKLTFLCVKEFDSLTLFFFIYDKKSIIILSIDYIENLIQSFDHS